MPSAAERIEPQALPESGRMTAGDGQRWSRGLMISIGAHALVVAGLAVGIVNTPPPPSTLPPAIALTMAPDPMAMPQPPSPIPPGPEAERSKAVDEPVPEKEPLDIPEVPTASAPVVTPPQKKVTPRPTVQDDAPRKKQESDRASAPPVPIAPPAPAMAAPVKGAAAQGFASAEKRWEAMVVATLDRKKRYPGEAQRRGIEDIVYLHLTIDRSGKVLDASIERSRKNPLLDRATLDLARRASPLPAPPSSEAGDRIDFVVPVEYKVATAR
ncbi:energy transducer TonB family protein [Sphingobium sp. TomMM35A]|uniref:TonB family protein n=2 Tax=Sphingomonadaceae TaxID=41297 RepID=A0ABT0E052_9SPHN|nr:TonB family protein [Sphingobium agri]